MNEWKRCKLCDDSFETNKKNDKLYCSEKCKQADKYFKTSLKKKSGTMYSIILFLHENKPHHLSKNVSSLKLKYYGLIECEAQFMNCKLSDKFYEMYGDLL